MNDVFVYPADLADKTRAKYGIYDGVTIKELRYYGVNRADSGHLYGHSGHYFKVLLCCAFELSFIVQKKDLDFPTIGVNLPGHNQPVPTIVTTAANDCDFVVLYADFLQHDEIHCLPGVPRQ